MYKAVRPEANPFHQIQLLAKIQQNRYNEVKKELLQAQNDCQRLMPYYRKIMGPRRLAASTYLTGEWLDDANLVCMVTNPEKRRSKKAEVRAMAVTKVDLNALLAKNFDSVCEKKCMAYDVGLCVHCIAGE